MRGAPFREGLRQQVAPPTGVRFLQGVVALQCTGPQQAFLDHSAVLFGPDAAMDEPFLIPGGLQGAGARLAQKGGDVGRSESAHTDMGARLVRVARSFVGVALVEWSVDPKQD